LRFAAGFVASVLSTPLPQVLCMKMSDFKKWRATAEQVFDVTRLKFE
jgi:hypothetical protein